MSLAELVITSVTVERRSKSEVARDYRISRYWVQTLVKRYEAEGEAAFEPRSRRPHTNPRAISLDLEDQIIRLRQELSKQGLEAVAETIRSHLQTSGVNRLPATSTIWRALTRRGLGSASALIKHGPLTFDATGRVAYINEQMLDLSARELGLLEVLLQRAGRLVSKDQLVERLCEWGDEVSNNAIEVYIHRLRKKIEQGPIRIATVRGLGYCLERIAS